MSERASDIDVVICTYDNEQQLDRVLGALGRQTAPDGWRVLVVDNNSGPATARVVERHRATGAVPGLRVVREATQGLTPARRRGVAATAAPWVAFVDDDCLLAPAWVEQALAFARAHPEAGAFGGRVVPTYEQPPPATLAERGWLFAEQDLGDEVQEVDCLVGAGMVLNREALESSGWTDEAFLADRVGRRLVSGGDVEIALRVAGTGRPLWYVPDLPPRPPGPADAHGAAVPRAPGPGPRGLGPAGPHPDLARVAAGLGPGGRARGPPVPGHHGPGGPIGPAGSHQPPRRPADRGLRVGLVDRSGPDGRSRPRRPVPVPRR